MPTAPDASPPRSPARISARALAKSDERREIRLAAGLLVLATLAVYANSLSAPFVFDDRPAILANPTLETFSSALTPPRDGGTTSGRPLVNLSLALNRAISGTAAWSYHAFNVLIHACAGLTLFGLVRRTLDGGSELARDCSSPGCEQARSHRVAFAAALLWLVHPLATAAVTYTVQRAESLMALFFLLTLYGSVRATQCDLLGDTRQRAGVAMWAAFSVLACLAGMACKEVMAVAPLVVLLHDRTFVAGSFAAALRARRGYYLSLASTWLLLAWLVMSNSARAGTAGFGGRIGSVDYAITQCAALVTYLRLTLWPAPLVFDYGTPLARFADVWPQTLLVLALLVATVAALARRPRTGFLAAAFLLILAPSSSFVPIHTQTIAEHRMYLPLALVTTAVAFLLARRFGPRVVPIACVLALPLAAATHLRNRTYHSAVALWSDTVATRPENPRAHNHLAVALAQAGRPAEAIPHFETALRLAPGDAEAHNNLATALAAVGRTSEALPHHDAAVRLNPNSAAARLNLANALSRADRPADAVPHFAVAAQLAPLDAAAHYNYGVALVRTRELAAAIEQFRAVLQRDPQHVGARVNLGNALLVTGRTADAIVEYEAALRLRPDDAQARANLARARTLLR